MLSEQVLNAPLRGEWFTPWNTTEGETVRDFLKIVDWDETVSLTKLNRLLKVCGILPIRAKED